MIKKTYKSGDRRNPLKDFTHISLHINSSLHWKTVRKLVDEWTNEFKIDMSTKKLLYYLMDFQYCQKYSQSLDLIKYITAIKAIDHINYWDDTITKKGRINLLFEYLNHYKGLALFIGPLNDELEKDWDMANQYENIFTMMIEGE